MKTLRQPLPRQYALWVFFLAVGSLAAQTGTQGQNDVYKNSTTQKGSSAFIAAKMFGSSSTDICTDIYNALAAMGSQPGVVIDARGNNSTNSLSNANGDLQCSGTPWYQGGTLITNPSSVLLPAGAIDITSTWVLPDRTRVFGEGMNSYGQASGGNGTAIVWTGASTGTMIQFGGTEGSTQVCPTVGSGPVCTGISLQDVFLNGNGKQVVGIENDFAQDLSYVDHVNLFHIAETGIRVTASFSGPYSNLSCSVGATSGGDLQCVELEASNTLGVHSLTGINSTAATAEGALYVDGSNNSIEDIHTEGFVDGIVVGANPLDLSGVVTAGDVFLDINTGDGSGPAVTNAIHICGSNVPSGATGCFIPASGLSSVSDLSVLGAFSDKVNATSITATLQDDISGVWLKQHGNLSSVGVYLIGDSQSVGTPTAYSRFTTSTYTSSPEITPAWLVGKSTPATSGISCATGSLYTNTTAGSANTLYVCVSGTGWQPVI